ncbi:spore coat protein [Oceanobacillus sp. 1P07AA]|uniref:spore coat protein n=1 Tax=Oceanobacillus sp. 1P07AA TaxID=3132293 RepID=UPI0039A420BF
MRRHHGGHCGCEKTVVHPTKHNCVNTCSESVVNHIHPSHTTVMNHHTVKNKHFYPHSTSFQNQTNNVNEYGGSFNVPNNQVAGAMSPGYGNGNGQVAGATSPGYGNGNCNSNQVGGSMHPGHHHWNKPNKWC